MPVKVSPVSVFHRFVALDEEKAGELYLRSGQTGSCRGCCCCLSSLAFQVPGWTPHQSSALDAFDCDSVSLSNPSSSLFLVVVSTPLSPRSDYSSFLCFLFPLQTKAAALIIKRTNTTNPTSKPPPLTFPVLYKRALICCHVEAFTRFHQIQHGRCYCGRHAVRRATLGPSYPHVSRAET